MHKNEAVSCKSHGRQVKPLILAASHLKKMQFLYVALVVFFSHCVSVSRYRNTRGAFG